MRNTIRNIKCFVSHTTVLVVGGVVIIEYIVQDAKTSVSFDDLQEQLSVISRISHAFVTIDKPTQTELRNRKKRLRKISEIYGKQ